MCINGIFIADDFLLRIALLRLFNTLLLCRNSLQAKIIILFLPDEPDLTLMKQLSLLFFSVFSFMSNATAQAVPNYSLYKKMNTSQLEAYRQSIWDSLPAIGWVNDFEGLFNSSEEDSLETILQHFEKETTVEIAIVTLDSNMVQNDKFNDFADHLLKIWGIGKFAKKNGVVICISRDYRKLFVSTGAGITKFMTDLDKYHIMGQNFIPPFNDHQYFTGTLSGLNEIMNKITKKRSRPGR